MKDKKNQEQITDWLQRLERESWQLELLVSAFTIFLLIQATGIFSDKIIEYSYTYSTEGFPVYLYLIFGLLNLSLKALTVFLIFHLLLRGFWIGAIGLRSVQQNVDYDQLKYSEFFTRKLQKRIMSFDALIVLLDDISSVIFSLAFLVISMLISFGLYLLFLGGYTFIILSVINITNGPVISIISILMTFILLITSIIYVIDYITLGFFKKWKVTSRWFYIIYRFYGTITLSFISRSIYYYLISKFSKRRIRLVVTATILFVLLFTIVDFDQYQYYPENTGELVLINNHYDDLRPEKDYIQTASISSKIVGDDYITLFLRYNPNHNREIRALCPNFRTAKNNGLNWTIDVRRDSLSLMITGRSYENENLDSLYICLSSLFEISINDSVYNKVDQFFYQHPAKNQKGLAAIIPTEHLPAGKNVISIKKYTIKEDETEATMVDYAEIPFWITN